MEGLLIVITMTVIRLILPFTLLLTLGEWLKDRRFSRKV